VPLIPFTIAGTLSLLAWVWLRKVKRLKFMGVRLGFMCIHQEQFEHYALSCISTAIPFLGIVYNNVCLKGFGIHSLHDTAARPGRARVVSASDHPEQHLLSHAGAFSCMALRDGTTVMSSVPSIVCWESAEHRALVGISIVAIIVYVIGVPAVTLGTVMYARHKDLLKNDKLMLALGYWYTWYGTYPSTCYVHRDASVAMCR
jgi:hypothetical protein